MGGVAGYHAIAVCGECGGQTFKVFIGDCEAGIAYQCQTCEFLDKGRWTPSRQPEASKSNGYSAVEGAGDVSNHVVSAAEGGEDWT